MAERVTIVVSSQGTVTVKSQIDAIATSSERAASGSTLLKGALAGLVTAGTVTALVGYADAYTNLQNRLKLVTNNSQELAAVTAEVTRIANENRQSIDSVATLYARAEPALARYGYTAKDSATFTDLFTKAVALSGTSAEEGAQGIYQFTQALNKGKLDGDEFRTVMEALPYVARTLADGLHVTTGELYALSAQGKITPKAIMDAFTEASAKIRGDFGQLAPTISSSLVVLNNNITTFIGHLNEATGASGLVAQAILFVAHNLDIVLVALAPLGVALGILAVETIGRLVIGAFTDFVAILTRVALAIVTTVIPAITTAITALVSFAATIVTTAIPAVAEFTAFLIANPVIGGLVVVALGAAAAAMYVFGISVQDVKNKVAELTGTLSEMLGAGLSLAGGRFDVNVNAQDAANQMLNSIKTAGAQAANSMGNGIKTAGSSAAKGMHDSIVDASAAFDQRAQAAIRAYEIANGTAVANMGSKIVESAATGAQYMYNDITGAVQKAAPEAADTLHGGIQVGGVVAGDYIRQQTVSGGQAAGDAISTALVLASAQGAAIMSNAIESQAESLVDAQIALIRAQGREATANAYKTNQEGRAVAEGRSGSGGTGFDSGSGRKSYTSGSEGSSFFPSFGNSSPSTSSSGKTVTTKTENLGSTTTVIKNIVDPKSSLDALDTAEGKKTIVNFMKTNKDDIKAALGVY